MFRDTRKEKLRNRVIYAALGVAVLTFGIWLNYQDGTDETAMEETVQEAAVAETIEKTEQPSTVSMEAASDIEDEEENTASNEAVAEESENQERTDTETMPETYLIKEVEGVVKVFICDEEGNQELYLITSIPFELLAESDQQLFIDGVELETEEDLGKFLENFDS